MTLYKGEKVENLETIISKPACVKIRDATFLPVTYLLGSSAGAFLGYNLPSSSENEHKLYATLGFAAGMLATAFLYEKLFMLIPLYREFINSRNND